MFHEHYLPFQHIHTSNLVLPNNIFLSSNYENVGSEMFPDVPMSSYQSISSPTPNIAQTSSPSIPFPYSTSSSPQVLVSQPPISISSTPPQSGRSIRAIKPPSYLQDYMCSHNTQVHPSISSHWCNLVHFSAFTQAQQ